MTVFSRKNPTLSNLGYWLLWLVLFVATLAAGPNALAQTCYPTITANVVVLDNPTVFNRLGAQNPNWITYALKRDVIAVDPTTRLPTADIPGTNLTAGNVELRPDKRPRPLVVRSVEGACLTVNFTNLLAPVANPNNAQQDNLINNDQVAGRCAGFHATGTELVDSIDDDGSMVGNNYPGGDVDNNCSDGSAKGSLVGPGGSITYNLYTPHEGAFTINSYGATIGSEASSGNTAVGMFGALNVEPIGSRIYRSQVTEEELRLATVGTVPSDCMGMDTVGVDCNPGGQPIIDYDALYPYNAPWISEGKAGLPILKMLTATNELVHSDINAIIVGPNGDGSFPNETYPLTSDGKNNPPLPNRLEPFREFTSIFHDEQTNSQVFPRWYNDPVLGFTLAGVKDQFMINSGSGGIGSEIIANRLHTGPMHDCTDCAYEEFFLSSSTVGDPALLVNFPANTGIEQCDPKAIAGPSCWRDPINLANGPVAFPDPATGDMVPVDNFALYQEDPSNVHHAYTGDFTKIRNTHAGSFEQHIFHLHNHQWLHNPNDDNANYLDAQEIMPGSGHTYELVNGGAGNRNRTAGDAIFHCHFYPHFAQGMWYHIRVMDVMETGSVLAVSDAADVDNPGNSFHTDSFELRSGKPAAGARALPDGELPDGVPIPAIVPLPGKAMPQMPAKVQVAAVDRGGHSLLGGRTPPDGFPDSSQAFVDRTSVAGADTILGTADDLSPGYPFWLAGNECGPAGDALTGECPNGIVGQRMPTPPLDMLTEAGAAPNGYAAAQAGGWDGGLPRHSLLGYVSGGLSADTQSRLDFRKVIELAQPVYFPEIGTDLEMVSMQYHAARERPSAANKLAGIDTMPVDFIQNGVAPVPGGPYQDPCVDDQRLRLGVDDGAGQWFDGDGDPETFNTTGTSEFSSINPRTYKLANIQIDAVFNKVGYHYPQERIIALWEDVAPTIAKLRPPEPLVMRFNTFDCGKILHTNLVPHEYELDDFQVRTPTDIIGQHIHLPKWDLTTGDGAANGWNYEDGALAPGIVVERIHAINEFNHLVADCVADPSMCIVPALTLPGQLGPIDLTGLAPVPTIDTGDSGSGVAVNATELHALPHPFFGAGVGDEYLGARTVIQRILIDPVVNIGLVDRGLGLTFSHDHYGPSTFQQIGLYSTILAEPAGSTWKHNESGVPLNTRLDGGPTTWQAAILTADAPPGGSNVGAENIPDHREFYFEMSDFQHAYEAGVYVGADENGRPVRTAIDNGNLADGSIFDVTFADAPALHDTWKKTVNPPLKLKSVPFPDIVTANDGCPGPLGNFDPNIRRPCAEAINISHSSMWVVNYRNEPVGLRVFDPNKVGPDGKKGAQADGLPGDLAFAFQSRTDRAISQLNSSSGDSPYPQASYCSGNGDGINCDRRPGDPFTPTLRAYEHDNVKIKIQVGATEEQHQSTFHGLKWLSNGSGFGRSPNSGWRNFQSHGISEQFSLQMPVIPDRNQIGNSVDYLYAQDATRDGMWGGTWGILRTYGNSQKDLYELPNNPQRGSISLADENNFSGVCPKFEMDADGNVIKEGKGRKAKPIPVPLKQFDIAAVLANKVLPNILGVTIPGNLNGDSDGDGIGDNAGGPLNPDGGTLVYNRRGTVVPDVVIPAEGPEPAQTLRGGAGPLNDPTAMMYVRLEELEPRWIDGVSQDYLPDNGDGTYGDYVVDPDTGERVKRPIDDRCQKFKADGSWNLRTVDPECPLQLVNDAPVEPLVLRANAGDCIEVTLHNKLMDQAIADVSEVATTNPAIWYDDNGTMKSLFDRVMADKLVLQGKTFETGDGIPVDIKNIVFDEVPDLAGWQDNFWVVNRDLFKAGRPNEMHFFNNNLIRPSGSAGLHAQLVEYDASRDDGVAVGDNAQSTLAQPRGQHTYRYYAGHIETKFDGFSGKGKKEKRNFRRVATPVEFGGTNLLSADRVKQPQKGLFGALVIEPVDATYPDALADLDDVADNQGSGEATRKTRAQVDVTSTEGYAGSGGNYREALAIGHKITNLRWADGTAIANVNQGELGREGAEDSGHAGFNYGMEPSWFRFELPPDVPFGNAGTPNSFGSIPNVHAFYANGLVAGEPNAVPAIPGVSEAGDPATPVFRTNVDTLGENPVFDTRMYVLNGASADRDGTFVLHGHLWQRDPYVCPWDSQDWYKDEWDGQHADVKLYGRCDPYKVASQALGFNPLGKWMGSEEGMGHVFGHWPILFDAGGSYGVKGDYLFRDFAPNGNRNGQFGILRAE